MEQIIVLQTASLCIHAFLCVDCTLLGPLDTLLTKTLISYHILFEAFPDFCSELTASSFVFLLNLLPVRNCKLHVSVITIRILSLMAQVVSYFSL